MTNESTKNQAVTRSIKAIAINSGCSLLLLTAGVTAGQAHTTDTGNTEGDTEIHYSHSFGYSNQSPDTTGSTNKSVSSSLRIIKGSTTKKLNAVLIIKNHTNETVRLRRTNNIRISNSNLPSTITLKPRQSKQINIKGTVNSKNGRTALGVAYKASNGEYISVMRHVNISDSQIKQINMGDVWELGTPTVKPAKGRLPQLSGNIRNFGQTGSSRGNKSNKMRSTKQSKKASLLDITNFNIANFDTQSLYQAITKHISRTTNSLSTSLGSLFVQPAFAAESVVRGSVAFKSMNTHGGRDLFLPYAGLRVVAIKESQNCNTSRPITSTTVNGEGNYAIRVNSNASKFRLCFRTSNNYAHLTGEEGQQTPWGWKTELLRTGTDYNRNYIDNFQPGVGDTWYTTMYYKTRVDAIGIDPVRTGRNKIQIVYPSDQCWQDVDEDGRIDRTAGIDYPWSCANRGGRISIKDDHAAPGDTVIHELAHQLDFKFGNSRGSGSGGNHGVWECTDPTRKKGLILTEGYANFEVARALSGGQNSDQYSRSWRPDMQGRAIYNGQLENPTACSERVTSIDSRGNHTYSSNVAASNPGLNAMERGSWAVFWDFYDYRNDGSDVIGFTSPGYLTYTYLNNNWDGLQGFLSRIYRDCTSERNRNVTNNGEVCRAIFAQNYSSDTTNQSAN